MTMAKKIEWNKTMHEFRALLDANSIIWYDCSDINPDCMFCMLRTHFTYLNAKWSVIIGTYSYGYEQNKLELMCSKVNDGEPIGYLTPKEAIDIVLRGSYK